MSNNGLLQKFFIFNGLFGIIIFTKVNIKHQTAQFKTSYQSGVLIHIQIQIIINYSLPCWDLNPGPPGTEYMKQIVYQCATVLLVAGY